MTASLIPASLPGARGETTDTIGARHASEGEAATLFAEIAQRLSAAAAADIARAAAFAETAHQGQIRASGEAYFTHPLGVATILLELAAADRDLLCAAFLHDVVEDCGVTPEQLAADFGTDVAEIVVGVTKFDQTRVGLGQNVKEETLRKLLIAGAQDQRIFSLKCADRLHNLRTLNFVARAKQIRVARETMSVFCPLAEYVGLTRFAVEMEFLAYRWAHPWRAAAIEHWIARKEQFDRRRIATATAALVNVQQLAESADARLGRAEQFSHALRLLREQSSSRALFATPSLFFAAPTMEWAYKEIAGWHKDAYALPGGFKSDLVGGTVHSTVFLGKHGPVVDLHYQFPPLRTRAFVFEGQGAASLEDLSIVVAGRGEEGELTKTLRELLRHRSITVLSPKGKPYLLPLSSTVLDFAFAVHSEIGLRAQGALVNGRAVHIFSELRSGDIVEVLTTEKVVASSSWIESLRSPRARAKLRHWLRDDSKVH
jgi:GTP diphosphokinase / guanosine-3',5'-bis(diphosphate) 3'-diphosphatase